MGILRAERARTQAAHHGSQGLFRGRSLLVEDGRVHDCSAVQAFAVGAVHAGCLCCGFPSVVDYGDLLVDDLAGGMGGRMPSVNRYWLEILSDSANSSQGLQVTAEPQVTVET
jgi:hypothetical protein